MDQLERFLLEGAPKKSATPEALRTLAKKAAAAFAEQGTDMNDSITAFAKEASLNEEQVKRVVEVANTEAFSILFSRGFKGGNVDFPVADASTVSSRLRTGSMSKTAAPRVKPSGRAYVPGEELATLADLFPTAPRQMEKTAAPTQRERMKTYFHLKDKLAYAEEDLDASVDAFNSTMETLQRACVKEYGESEDVPGLFQLFKAAGVDLKLADMIYSDLRPRLGVNTVDEQIQLKKMASGVLDTDHAIVKLAKQLVAKRDKLLHIYDEFESLTEQLATAKKDMGL
jgi:hypothetical protein